MNTRGNDEEEALPVLFEYCEKAYGLMLSGATEVGTYENGEPCIVWEGFLTRLIAQDMLLSVPYYTAVTRALKRMGCIRQLRRGGGTTPSQWELITQPTPELFNREVTTEKQPAGKVPQLEQQMRSVISRVNTLEENLRQIMEGQS